MGKHYAIKWAPDSVVEPFDFEGTIPFYAEARRLTRELGVPHEVDHIVPVTRGGRHEPSNLQVITKQANLAKRFTE
jgi:hypothetical protein